MPSTASTAEPQRPAASEDLAQRFIDRLHALEQGGNAEVEAMAGLFSDASAMASPALRQASVQRTGREGVRAFWREYVTALRGARTEFGHVTVGERSVGLFWTTHAAPASGDGPSIAYRGSTLLEHDGDGRIVRFEAYFDPRELEPNRGSADAAGSG